MGHWEDGEFVLAGYLTGHRTAVSPLVLQFLDGLTDPTPASAVRERFGAMPGGEPVLRELLAQQVVLEVGSDTERRDAELAATWAWSQDARYFHFSTRDIQFQDLAAEREDLARLAGDGPPPPPTKSITGARHPLPAPARPGGDFFTTLADRRTRRKFAAEPVTAAELGTLLGWTWGKSRDMDDPVLGRYILKTSPSGGARHPIEVYPMVLGVDGVAPGLYHYDVDGHVLVELQPGDHRDLAVELCAGQHWVRDAAVVCFMTAAVTRSMWKYRHSHAYRVVLLDAGHLGQTFHLVCTRLGLATFTSAALDAPAVEAGLRLDGISEIAVYAAAAGRPG